MTTMKWKVLFPRPRDVVLMSVLTLAAGSSPASALLLSDIAYHALQQDMAAAMQWQRFSLHDGKLDRLQMEYDDQTYDIPFKRQGRKYHIRFPGFVCFAGKISGYRRDRKLFQKKITVASLDLDDKMFSQVKVVQPFKTYRGGFLFADAVARLSQDYLEPERKENAVFIRGIDKDLRTTFLYFIPPEDRTGLAVPHRERVGVGVMGHDLYYFDHTRIHRQHLFKKKSEVFQRQPSACVGSVIADHNYQVRLLAQHLFVDVYATPCGPKTDLRDKDKNKDKDAVIKQYHVLLPPQVYGPWRSQEISSYALEKVQDRGRGYYLLLLQFAPEYEFMQRDVSDDLVLVFDQNFVLDGALRVANTYYSPRTNMAYMPRLEEILASIQDAK